MLKRLYVDNFKCLVNFDFELRDVRVGCLVGPNGSGKSAIFNVLQGIQGFLSGDMVGDAFPSWTCTRWSQRDRQHFELDVIGPRGTPFHYDLVVHHDQTSRRSLVERESVAAEGRLLYEQTGDGISLYGDVPATSPRTTFPGDPRRSFLPLLQPRADDKLLMEFKEWLGCLWLFALRPADLSPEATGEAEILSTDGRNFVSWYRTILQEAPETVNQIWKDLSPIVSGLQAIKLQKIGLESRLLLLDCIVAGRPFSLATGELSDGQRILLLLYAILHVLAPKASLIVFDEPDNFVAEDEIQPWLSRMREAILEANRGSLLAISHHHRVIDYLAADGAWEVRRTDDGPARLQEVQIPRETGLSASEYLRLGVPHAE